MRFLKAIILIIAITMTLSITLTMNNLITQQKEEAKLTSADGDFPSQEEGKLLRLPSKKVSRFLAQNDYPRNPNGADHCHKDYEICALIGAKNSTCCNNKCIDTGYDNHNCGMCKKKCKYTETCCRGQCVDTNFDKRHCGYCNHRCELGQFCVYGLCDYA